MYELALPLLAYELTKSSEAMGLVRAIEFLPHILLAVFIGAWVDRVDRKRWSQWMLVGQILTLITGWLAVEFMTKPLWVISLCAFFMMAFNYGYLNARMGMLKHVLPSNLQNSATAKISTLNGFFEAVGPVLSGAVMLLSSVHAIFVWVALVMILALYQLTKMPYHIDIVSPQGSIVSSLGEGWRAVRENIPLLHMSIAAMFINTASIVFTLQAIYYAKSILSMSSIEVAYMAASGGLGGVLGSLCSDKLRKQFGLGSVLIATVMAQSLGYLFILFCSDMFILIFAYFWVSAFGIVIAVSIWSYRQESIKKEELGRVVGITGTLFKLGLPFGLVMSGYVVSTFGVEFLFILCASSQSFVGVMCLRSPLVNIK